MEEKNPPPVELMTLSLAGCVSLVSLPSQLPDSLGYLNLTECCSLTKVPRLPKNLTVLNLSYCSSLTELPDLPSSLVSLTITGCSQLKALPTLPKNLMFLSLAGCLELTSLPRLPSRLVLLDLTGCLSLRTLPTQLPLGLNIMGIETVQKTQLQAKQSPKKRARQLPGSLGKN